MNKTLVANLTTKLIAHEMAQEDYERQLDSIDEDLVLLGTELDNMRIELAQILDRMNKEIKYSENMATENTRLHNRLAEVEKERDFTHGL